MSEDLPLGIRQNNPGNIDYMRHITWQGQKLPQPPGERFAYFMDPQWGIRAIMKLLINYREEHNCVTLEDFISRWAPENENNLDAYIADVIDYMNAHSPEGYHIENKDTEINPKSWIDLLYLTEAIIHHENGLQPYSKAILRLAAVAAGVLPR